MFYENAIIHIKCLVHNKYSVTDNFFKITQFFKSIFSIQCSGTTKDILMNF